MTGWRIPATSDDPSPPPPPPAAVRRRRVELAVRRDLRELGRPLSRSALAEMALVLARAIDSRGDESPATTAKLVGELRVTLGQLREVARGSGEPDQEADYATPAWDAAQSGAADVGAEGGGGGPPAG